MGTKRYKLTDSEWFRIKDMLPSEHQPRGKRGRLAKYDNRSTMNGILWIARSRAPWGELPERVDDRCNVEIISNIDFIPTTTDYVHSIELLIDYMQIHFPNWGLIGCAGITFAGIGYSGSDYVCYAGNNHFGPNLSTVILPAKILDGNIFIINTDAFAKHGVSVPDQIPEQSLARELSELCRKNNLGLFIAPQLACYDEKLIGREGLLKLLPPSSESEDNHDLEITVAEKQSNRTVAFVVRTQFKRVELLQRNLNSLIEFIKQTKSHTRFEIHLLSDQEVIPERLKSFLTLIHFHSYKIKNKEDTRFLLIQNAIADIAADWFWFVDDDDFLFSDHALHLSLLLKLLPTESAVFVDSQVYFDEPHITIINPAEIAQKSAGVYPAKDFLKSLTGANHIPFSGMLFPKSAFKNISSTLWDEMTYFEDYACQLFCLLDPQTLPVIISKLYTGISLRNSGQSITLKDRTIWNQSSTILKHELANTSPSYLLSFAEFIEQSSKTSDQLAESVIESTNKIHIIKKHHKEELSNANAKFQQQVDKQQAEFLEQIAEIKKEAANSIHEVEERYKEELSATKAEATRKYNDLNLNHAKELNSVKTMFTSQISQLQADFSAKIRSKEAHYAKATAEREKYFVEKMTSIQTRYERLVILHNQQQKELADCLTAYAAIQNSTCWTVTAPLRKVLDKIKLIYKTLLNK